jgi:glycosyltransferase involved in cell wall biosynthesis
MIDVFIPVYNDKTFLPLSVGSALSQQDVDVRVIISDNASTDGTFEWAVEQSRSDPRVIVFRNDRNLGLFGNVNRFRELVTAEYYMFLCSDDLLVNDRALATAKTAMAENPSVVSITCDLNFIDVGGKTMNKRSFRRSGIYDAQQTLRETIITSRNQFVVPLLNRTSAARQFTYPEHLTYAADVHFSALLAQVGEHYHIPQPMIAVRFTGKNMTTGIFQESWKQMDAIAHSFNVRLTWIESSRRILSHYVVMAAKKAFLSIASLRAELAKQRR